MSIIYKFLYGPRLILVVIASLGFAFLLGRIRKKSLRGSFLNACSIIMLCVLTITILYLTILMRLPGAGIGEGLVTLAPFSLIGNGQSNSEIYRVALANFLMFVPFGALTADVISAKLAYKSAGKIEQPAVKSTEAPSPDDESAEAHSPAVESAEIISTRKVILYAAVAGVALSILIELTQYLCGIGHTETDDVIMNGLGAIVGAVLWAAARGTR